MANKRLAQLELDKRRLEIDRFKLSNALMEIIETIKTYGHYQDCPEFLCDVETIAEDALKSVNIKRVKSG